MGSLANDRKWALEKKNEAAIKAMDIEKKAESFKEKKKEVEDGISRIPSDLPDELQQQIDAAVDNSRKEMEREADQIKDEAYEAKSDAEEALRDMGNIRDDYKDKSDKLKRVSNIPLIGGFAEMKAKELDDYSGQMSDIALETQKFADKLAESRNGL